ncbi:MAG: hypothetical protein FWD91_08480, partial [Treponema sp.]|nr:hypothetical protein [Treponema sp.]
MSDTQKPVDAGLRTLRFSRLLRFSSALFCLLLAWTSCGSTPAPSQVFLAMQIRLPPPPASGGMPALPPALPAPAPVAPAPGTGSIVEQIRFHTERGTPASILEALEIIRSRNLG